ncbi:hypothetical protein [uncultured Kocuria sp.]|uniref:hypothetical protein n=1 Tax=uncultured Kocuria sp. TaxID=259305 RepID=UPI0026053CCC|nr:hypothetical protein [uncultured Kocuria sp.]
MYYLVKYPKKGLAETIREQGSLTLHNNGTAPVFNVVMLIQTPNGMLRYWDLELPILFPTGKEGVEVHDFQIVARRLEEDGREFFDRIPGPHSEWYPRPYNMYLRFTDSSGRQWTKRDDHKMSHQIDNRIENNSEHYPLLTQEEWMRGFTGRQGS